MDEENSNPSEIQPLEAEPPDVQPPEPSPPFQYSLRTLFLITTLAAILAAFIRWGNDYGEKFWSPVGFIAVVFGMTAVIIAGTVSVAGNFGRIELLFWYRMLPKLFVLAIFTGVFLLIASLLSH